MDPASSASSGSAALGVSQQHEQHEQHEQQEQQEQHDRWREGGRNPFPTFYAGASTLTRYITLLTSSSKYHMSYLIRHTSYVPPDLPAADSGSRGRATKEGSNYADSDFSLDLSIGKRLERLFPSLTPL